MAQLATNERGLGNMVSKFRLIDEIEALGIAEEVVETFGHGLLYLSSEQLKEALKNDRRSKSGNEKR